MKIVSAVAAIAALAGGGAAYAQDAGAPQAAAPKPADNGSGFYVGGGINLYFLDKDQAARGMPITFVDQPSPGAFMGRLGYALNRNIAIEVEAGIGGARSQFSTSGGNNADGEIGVETPLGAHLVLSMPMGDSAYVMGKAGYVTTKISREYLGVEYQELTMNGTAFGAGAGFRSGSMDYRIEYSFTSSDDGDAGVLGLFLFSHF